MPRKGYAWVKVPGKPKFDQSEKEEILKQVQEFVDNSDRLKEKVSRVAMRANYVYLYELVEQFVSPEAVLIKPLIDDKFLEFPYARITITNKSSMESKVDWQRHNDKWMTLYEDKLETCLIFIDTDEWFDR